MSSSKREMVLSALLANPTIRDASKACGVPERTIYTWLNKPDFKAEYERQRSQLVQSAWDALRGKLTEAISVVSELMEDDSTPPQVRLSAARAVLEYSLRATEQLDILPRLEALEAAQNGAERQAGGEIYWVRGNG